MGINYGSIGAAGQASGWELLQSVTLAGQAEFDFLNIPTGKDVLVTARSVTKSVSTLLALRVSIDNGATFLSAFGDYLQISTAGLDTSVSFVLFHNVNATLGRTAGIELKGAPPFQWAVNMNGPLKIPHASIHPCRFVVRARPAGPRSADPSAARNVV